VLRIKLLRKSLIFYCWEKKKVCLKRYNLFNPVFGGERDQCQHEELLSYCCKQTLDSRRTQEETFRVKGNTVIHANEGEKKGSSDNKHVNKRWHSCTCGIPRHRESPFSSSFLFLELKILILDLGK
jgi:hypothetical protein